MDATPEGTGSRSRLLPAPPPGSAHDALEQATIDLIEEHHAAVVRAEAEQRFGVFRGGRRAAELGEAEQAERAFLEAHGFGSYNDYRLSIRRSTVSRPDDSPPAGPPAALAPAAVTSAIVTPPPEEGAVPSGRPLLAEPAPQPQAVQPSQHERVHPAAVDGPPSPARLRDLAESTIAEARDAVDALMSSHVGAAEERATEILDRAVGQAERIVADAASVLDEAGRLLDDTSRVSASLVATMGELPPWLGRAGSEVAADLDALRMLAQAPLSVRPAHDGQVPPVPVEPQLSP